MHLPPLYIHHPSTVHRLPLPPPSPLPIPPSPNKMSCSSTHLLITLLLYLLLPATPSSNSKQDPGLLLLESSRAWVSEAKEYYWALQQQQASASSTPLADCARLYEEAESRLSRLTTNTCGSNMISHRCSNHDRLAWISAALTNHRTCLDGMLMAENDDNNIYTRDVRRGSRDREAKISTLITRLLNDALACYHHHGVIDSNDWIGGANEVVLDHHHQLEPYDEDQGILASWNPAAETSRPADMVVAKDGSGHYRTVMDAVADLSKTRRSQSAPVIVVYVKAGIYKEHVIIGRHLDRVMLVGDGIDRTIITGSRNAIDGCTTLIDSATFSVSGDGFWERDITFENTAGPEKHQAVALMAASDLSVFYRCRFRGYQDTLYAHSLRQFYRDCQIHGTIDFIFGNAAVVLQNCDIFIRKPMWKQANMITAQGRDTQHENTGIMIQGSRIRSSPDFAMVNGSYRSFLGRPWRKYSRTVIARTYMDGLVDPRGWMEWDGSFALKTLFYAEYRNTGAGSSTQGRVKWPGYHVLRDAREVGPFTVRNFVQGNAWIPATGVPVELDI